MYKTIPNPASILIIKTSSLGDIIQTFNVLSDLKSRFPDVMIDWAVEAAYYSLVAAHPLVRHAIPLHFRQKGSFFSSLRALRKERYDVVFDFQGNCKSGFFTLFARGALKIGYGLQSVREWPNVLATHLRFNVSRHQNIRFFYLGLLESVFGKVPLSSVDPIRLRIDPTEQEKLVQLLRPFPDTFRIMVCPGSKWVNKQLSLPTLKGFLQKIEQTYKDASFFLVGGTEEERTHCRALAEELSCAALLDRLSLPLWQNLMEEMDLVVAVDSSALHLCGTTSTPSFSVFGPTSAAVFKPIGSRHHALQGACPYQRSFAKQCSQLRRCPTGGCIRHLAAEPLFTEFYQWFSSIDRSRHISRRL